MYDRPLLMDVLDETGGSLRKFLTRVLLGTRDESTSVDSVAAEEAADTLLEACKPENRAGFFSFLTGSDPQGDVRSSPACMKPARAHTLPVWSALQAFIDILTHANHFQIMEINRVYQQKNPSSLSLEDEIEGMSWGAHFEDQATGAIDKAKEAAENAQAQLSESLLAVNDAAVAGNAEMLQNAVDAAQRARTVAVLSAKLAEARKVLGALDSASNNANMQPATDEPGSDAPWSQRRADDKASLRAHWGALEPWVNVIGELELEVGGAEKEFEALDEVLATIHGLAFLTSTSGGGQQNVAANKVVAALSVRLASEQGAAAAARRTAQRAQIQAVKVALKKRQGEMEMELELDTKGKSIKEQLDKNKVKKAVYKNVHSPEYKGLAVNDSWQSLQELWSSLDSAEIAWSSCGADVASAEKDRDKICPTAGSPFKKILQFAMKDRITIFANLLNNAMNSWSGADNTSITRILGGQDRHTVDLIRERYQALYTTPLISDLDDKCSGLFGKIPLLGSLFKPDLRMALTSWVVSEGVGEEMPPDPSEALLRFQQSAYLEGVKAERQRLLNEIDAASYYVACNDARDVRSACVGFGTDEDKLSRCLVGRTRAQLERTDDAYVYMYGTTLAGQIKDETSGHYKNLLLAIVQDQGRVDALNFYAAVKGWGANEKLLNELCVTCPNKRLQAAKGAFWKAFDRDMVMEIKDDTSGGYAKLLVRLLQCDRQEVFATVDEERAVQQAADLADAEWANTAGKVLPEDEKFLRFLANESRAQIELVASTYEAENGETLQAKLQTVFEGWFTFSSIFGASDLQKLCQLLCYDCINACCELVHEALTNATFWEGGLDGVDDDCVGRILGSADVATLEAIKDTYFKRFGIPLEEELDTQMGDGFFVKNDFKYALLRWLTCKKIGGRDLQMEKDLTDAGHIDIKKQEDVMKLEPDKLTAKELRRANSKLQHELTEALDFIANYDAGQIRKACRGLGTNDSTLINILTGRSKAQLQRIDRQYQLKYDHCLIEEIEAETSGYYKEFLSAAITEKSKLAARGLQKAMEGWGTDDTALIEVICTRNNTELREAKNAYTRMYDKPLSVVVRQDTSGDYKRTLTRMLQARREEWLVEDEPRAIDDAQELYRAAEGLGTDEAVFIRILTKSSPAQIRCIDKHYQEMYKETLDEVIDDEFSGNVRRCLKMLAKDRLDVWATLVHDALTETTFTADKSVLVRILGGADKSTVKAIARRYLKLFGAPMVLHLQENISGVFGGDLRSALISWVENETIGEEEKPPDPNLTPCEDATVEYYRLRSLLENALDYITRIDAMRIREACVGFGTDDDTLIRILTGRTKDQLQRTDDTYVMRYGMTLIGQINLECFNFFGLFKSPYQEMMENILRDSPKVDAMSFRKAIEGWGTHETLLTELVCTRTNRQLLEAQEAYEIIYGRDLAQDVKDDTSGTYKNFLVRLLRCKRIEDAADDILIRVGTEDLSPEEVADKLKESGASDGSEMKANLDRKIEKLELMIEEETDERRRNDLEKSLTGMKGNFQTETDKILVDVLTGSSVEQIAAVANAFGGVEDLGGFIDEQLGGFFADLFGANDLKFCCKMMLKDSIAVRCQLLKDSFDSFSVDKKLVMRIIGGSDKQTVQAIMACYEQDKFGGEAIAAADHGDAGEQENGMKMSKLVKTLKEKLSGTFLKAVIAWIESPAVGIDEDPELEGLRIEHLPDDLEAANELLEAALEEMLNEAASRDAAIMNKACAGIGTDDEKMLSLLTSRTKDQLDRLDIAYQRLYAKTLSEEIKSETEWDLLTSSDYADFLLAKTMSSDEADAISFRQCIAGWGTQDDVLIELCGTRSNEELQNAKEKYAELYDRDLVDDVKSDTSGDYKKFCVALLGGGLKFVSFELTQLTVNNCTCQNRDQLHFLKQAVIVTGLFRRGCRRGHM